MQQEIIRNSAANFNYLNNMPCNTVVHLQILTPTKAIRLKTRLIGIDPNMSVILAIRHEDDWYTARNYMREGQGSIVRLMSLGSSEASIIAFRTNIQKIMHITGNWLVMDYPKELQKVSLRNHSRIPIHIACAIVDQKFQTVLTRGFLSDISIKGCAFVGDILAGGQVGNQYNLQIKLDGKESPQIIPVTVKNCGEIAHYTVQQHYGLAFPENNQETQDSIQKIILHHLCHPIPPKIAVNAH